VSEPIAVLVADDHAPTRADVKGILADDGRFAVRAEAADAAGAVAAALEARPDVCLLDVRMPGGGVGAAWEISARLPNTKIVMLTVSRDDADLFAALRAGASGYLLKDLDPDRLPDALAAVVAGEGALPGSLVARLVNEFRDGLTTAQIADRLVISRATVRSHVAGILRKLRVPDREAALELFRSQS
jgi:DNA-binding NarL/FixJ family response regulator